MVTGLHRDDHYAAVKGWFMALDAGLVPETFRTVLEDPLVSRGQVKTQGFWD